MLAGLSCDRGYTYEIANELAVGLSGSSHDLSACSVGYAICNVLRDCAREEYGLLTDVTDLPPQLFCVQGGDVSAVDGYGSRVGDVET